MPAALRCGALPQTIDIEARSFAGNLIIVSVGLEVPCGALLSRSRPAEASSSPPLGPALALCRHSPPRLLRCPSMLPASAALPLQAYSLLSFITYSMQNRGPSSAVAWFLL